MCTSAPPLSEVVDWAECEDCKTWVLLPDGARVPLESEKWTCGMIGKRCELTAPFVLKQQVAIINQLVDRIASDDEGIDIPTWTHDWMCLNQGYGTMKLGSLVSSSACLSSAHCETSPNISPG